MSPLLSPLPSVDAYVAHFTRRPLPVLRRTVRELDALRADPERAGGRQIAAIVLDDPLMTMRLLTYIETHRRQSQNHDITTIERAVMMIGIEPFFRLFDSSPTVEDALKDHPRALVGVLKVITRARHISGLAREFAVMRHDLDVQEITVAASLHEATEIICWIHAPGLTEQVYALQTADRRLRSADAQRQVFGVTAGELQLGLIRAWRLPRLLMQLLDDSQQNDPRVRTVSLAARIARHLARGWDDPGLPDDIDELEALLRVSRETLLKRLGAPDDARGYLLAPPHASE
ncbi:HDOD domain-containing protein [Thauera linaloolentis]|uniref:HDOD domain-containing protein n=1 Tax=Thauera linaloolentis TaxID=76112 RepID=UPI0004918567|nr:HDOD domain-containing protein [Thauera linaloolentis]MCM8567023.1 HDOD domain-containing protein [Thauera linaloolentis]